ncbi:calcitonin gene-related peptide type 1 receptor-like [Mercenaria mercenaria]|uniref:calcitonin gene-related peptide type 1 receptor-like n=1 Tax=Mercenaria mercenaria TaxID=6596 RepID=UPI00234EF76C|nr:calcitonin gene-related peptide type 1 receptor-like [Mercenaria mercenaria]XP_053373093.1 calcitonin gene-related peptide type 1 receptor-like [Mercenaria mercenaria]XP_053373094.1 calcitonin gene-related peptide type 1 receptor-like [Mercenaria mercenaria]XP_053373095.1 calcitonin gene-related peptide type 1 receptor-like [Mercenaria mercenaria]
MEMNNVNFTARVEESTTKLGKIVQSRDNDIVVAEQNKYAHGAMELPKDYILDYVEYRHVLEDCNASIHKTPYPSDGGTYCNATWDRMQCWGYTKAGETVLQPCPAYITLSNPLAYSKKVCNSDGTWFSHPVTGRVWTNYTMCYDHTLVENHKRVLYMYYYGFSISIVLLIISLIIFSLFRQLKCVRVTLHKHLFSSYIVTGALWIMYYAMVPMSSDVLLHNPLWCQILHVLTHYFTVCNYAWMFCEGFYLHALMVIAFTKDKKLLIICYLIGWVFPILPTLIYTIIRALYSDDNNRCWTGDSNLHWILAGPINASLIVNFIFSINIMRILLSKLRSVHTNETMQTRRAVRATLILIPLLGLQYIAFPFKPPPGSDGEYVYAMISAFLVSFQGVFVSVVFCFFNGEVIRCFKKKWHRFRMERSKKYRDSKNSGKQNGESRSMLRSMTSEGETKVTLQTISTNNNCD